MYMTDWEKQMMAAQMMRDPRQSPAVPDPGMVTQTAGAPNPEAASVEGQQGAIDNQMAYANMLRGRSAPQGREVGPSGIYMGPNIGETLAHAGEQALGGYLAGKANKKQAGLDKTRSAAEAARIQKEEERYAAKEAREQRRIDLEGERLGFQREQAEAKLAEEKAREGKAILKKEADAEVDAMVVDAEGAVEAAERRREQADRLMDDHKDYTKEETKRQAKAEAEANKPLTQAQGIAKYRSDSFDDGMNNMSALLGDWDADKGNYTGYDPTTWSAYWDKATNTFDTTRFLSSPEGQQWATHSETMKEAALRTATGAAAPETENSAYVKTLIPSPGDDPQTVRAKMQKLERFSGYLNELGGGESQEAANIAFEVAAMKSRNEDDAPPEADDSGYAEGDTATHPETGEVMVYRNGKWVEA